MQGKLDTDHWFSLWLFVTKNIEAHIVCSVYLVVFYCRNSRSFSRALSHLQRPSFPPNPRSILCYTRKCGGKSGSELYHCLIKPCLWSKEHHPNVEDTAVTRPLDVPSKKQTDQDQWLQECFSNLCAKTEDVQACFTRRCLGELPPLERFTEMVASCERICSKFGSYQEQCQKTCENLNKDSRKDKELIEITQRDRRTWHDPLVCAEKKCKNLSGVSLIVCRSQHCG